VFTYELLHTQQAGGLRFNGLDDKAKSDNVSDVMSTATFSRDVRSHAVADCL
jgi:hypothetical protein